MVATTPVSLVTLCVDIAGLVFIRWIKISNLYIRIFSILNAVVYLPQNILYAAQLKPTNQPYELQDISLYQNNQLNSQ